MNIVVCVKQVPNPEIPMGKFRIDSAANRVLPPEGIPPVISPFDEQAVEMALRLKEEHGGMITAISMGPPSAQDVVKHSLAMGADEGVLLQDALFEDCDSFSTAYALSKAIEKLGQYDLILCGRQAADWDQGQVGSVIAENLRIPIITFARKIELVDSRLRVERVILDGYEVIEADMPAVVTISSEVGQPRLPSGFGIITAARKKVPAWTAGDIGADASLLGPAAARTELLSLFVPSREGECEIIQGETGAEAAAKLAMRLREAKIV